MAGYAVIETGGKQYKVSEGDVFDVERLGTEAGKKIKLDQVLALSTGKTLTVGAPLVSGASVTAEVLEHFRGDKVVVFKKKRRKGYENKKGHRQELTKIRIAAIGKARKAKPKAEAKAEAPAAEAEAPAATPEASTQA